mgnify:CR=1 FL=1
MNPTFDRLALAIACLFLSAPMLRADDISDALQAAQDAYAANDLKTLGEQILAADHALRARQSDLLLAYLPEAPEGFTKTVNAEFSSGFALFGGGSGVEAQYTSDAATFTIDIYADNSMVSSMAQMFASTEMMAVMGMVETVGDTGLIVQDQTITGMAGTRVLLSAQGTDTAVMLPVLKTMDFAKLAEFDKVP